MAITTIAMAITTGQILFEGRFPLTAPILHSTAGVASWRMVLNLTAKNLESDKAHSGKKVDEVIE